LGNVSSSRDHQVPSPRSAPITKVTDSCASEPIHIPGSIQPHGFLFVLDRANGTILQASESVLRHLGIPASALLGAKLAELVRDPDGEFPQRLEAATQAEHAPFHLGSLTFLSGSGDFDLVVHRSGEAILAEFEPAAPASQLAGLGDFVGRAQQCETVDDLCELAVEEIKKLTGYGRVVAYEFNSEGHGRVNAERHDPGYVSFRGLHFPASDIPEQARRLYLVNRLRCIPDARYEPSPLVPRDNPLTGAPTDLSFAELRSISPSHLRYMEAMGTMASMSISLVVQGRLWGMISCHHAQPRTVPLAVRTQTNLLAQIVSLQIEARRAQGEAARRHELQHLTGMLLSAMAEHDNVPAGLISVPQALLEFARAGGAAVVHSGECLTVGQTPERDDILALCARLPGMAKSGLFHTRDLPAVAPEFASVRKQACGVLAISISELHPNYVLWFRPEWIRSINWAGRGPIPDAEAAARATERTFRPWPQEIRGQSLPWEPWELDSAAELRTAITGVVLRKAEELAGLADELGRTNQELEAFSYSVSHDLRAPLRHIAGYAELLQEYEGAQLSARASRYLANIGDSARFAGRLVDALLTFSQMGRSALKPTQVNLTQTMEQIRRELAPDLQGREVDWVSHELPEVYADAGYIHLALRNLLSNAIKYTRDREPAVIEVGAHPQGGGHVIYVRDNGVGFDMKYAGKLFGVFQRLHRMEDFEGTGIGLANVRRIVERHGGRVWAEGVPDRGATFYLFLPGADSGAAAAPSASHKNSRS